MFPSPFARLFGIKSASFVTANHTVNSRGKLPENGIVIRKLSFEFGGTSLPYLCLLRRNSCAAGGYASLVTAVRFSNGQEALFIDYSSAKYVRSAPKIAAVLKSLFRVVENEKFLNRLRNGHLEKSAVTGLFRA
jgi:hypothetical protein